MKTIFKYPLATTVTLILKVPAGAKIIHAGLDPKGEPCLWAEVEPDNPTEILYLCFVRTGIQDDEWKEARKVATKHIASFAWGKYMLHLYYRQV